MAMIFILQPGSPNATFVAFVFLLVAVYIKDLTEDFSGPTLLAIRCHRHFAANVASVPIGHLKRETWGLHETYSEAGNPSTFGATTQADQDNRLEHRGRQHADVCGLCDRTNDIDHPGLRDGQARPGNQRSRAAPFQ